jgi:hypothetical protein
VSTAAPEGQGSEAGSQYGDWDAMDQDVAENATDQRLPVSVKDEIGGTPVAEPSREIVEHRMDVDVEPVVKPEPPIQHRAMTPNVTQRPMTGNTTASVTFAIPSPELSPAPSLPPAEPPTETPTGDDLARPRSVSVMTVPGAGAAMPTASDMGTPTQPGTGMDELSEAMMAEAAAQGRVVLQGKGKPYLRAKKPLKDVLRKILADIRRKDAVSCYYCRNALQSWRFDW